MTQRSNESYDGANLIWVMIGLILMVIFGLWLISAWLTRQLVEHVLNPMTNQTLARNDGLLIIVSALLWGAMWPLIVFPRLLAEMSPDSPAEIRQAFIGTLLIGLAWGISVGVKVLGDLWLAVEEQPEPAYEPVERLGTPMKIVSTPSANGHNTLPPRAKMEQEIDQAFGGNHAEPGRKG